MHLHWTPRLNSADTTAVLPVTSDELALVIRGCRGRVRVIQASGEHVQVHVRVTEPARVHVRQHQATVRIDGDNVEVEVEVTLTRHITAFRTDTDNIAHEIGDLWQSLHFDRIDLRTSNAPIHANSITLTRGSLTTSNGPISGHFNTSRALVLATANGHIHATASLLDAGGTAQLEMRTSNSPITASVSLTTDTGSDGHFVVRAHASNSPIQLRYDDAPSRSRLLSDVQTSNGSASVRMHPTFEGAFEVATSNDRAIVRDTRAGDPSGMGRRRIVHQTGYRGTVTGTVSWDEGTRGRTTVQTSNARASLDL